MLIAMVLAATIAAAVPPGSSPGATQAASQPAATTESPLAEAIAHYKDVKSYLVTIHSFHGDGEEYIHYFYRKPGYVRMEFIRPHKGALLVYSPATGRARLWPFGYGHFPELDLSPHNRLIRSPRGQYVDHSDIGALFANISTLLAKGSMQVLPPETVDGHTMAHFVVTGNPGAVIEDVHRFEVWLDTTTWFPRKIISQNVRGVMLERVTMDDLELNPPLPDKLFNP